MRLAAKERLEKISFDRPIERYAIVNKRVSDIWGSISDKAIISAWKIPGLIESETEEEDEYLPNL